MRVAILTVSDKGFKGEREDLSGPAIEKIMEKEGAEVVASEIVPDEKTLIEEKLKDFADHQKVEVILTTGGTGLSPRDVTPEATRAVIEKEAPGFAEAMRFLNLKTTPYAMLSRGVSGLRGKTLIINLPGSVFGVKECLRTILAVLPHALEMLQGQNHEHS